MSLSVPHNLIEQTKLFSVSS